MRLGIRRMWIGVAVAVALLVVVALVVVFVPGVRASLVGLFDPEGGGIRISAADVAAASGVAALLLLMGLGWKMAAFARHLYQPTDTSDGTSVGPGAAEQPSIKSLYRLVLDLDARINVLQSEIRHLSSGSIATDSNQAASAEGRAESRRQGPGRLRDDFFTEDIAVNNKARGRGSEPQRATAPLATDRPRARENSASPDMRAADIANLAKSPEIQAVVDSYHQVLAGRMNPSDFERTYQPELLGSNDDGAFLSVRSDADAFFWLIPARGDPSIGILVPSKEPIKSWPSRYQFGGGTGARKVFGTAFQVDPGDSLELIQPAWVTLRSDGIDLARKGHLSGA